jgi:hypothetical protein
VFVEELLVAQLVNKFSTYYEIRKASYSVCIDIVLSEKYRWALLVRWLIKLSLVKCNEFVGREGCPRAGGKDLQLLLPTQRVQI